MSASKNRAGAPTRRHARVIKVAPVTRAIRAALAVSATTLALSASGGAFAGNCTAPNATAIHCNGSFYQSEIHPAMDLTVIPGDAPSNVVSSAGTGAGHQAAITRAIEPANAPEAESFGAVQNLVVVDSLAAGPGGGNGSDVVVGWNVVPGATGFGSTGPWSATSATGIADAIFASGDRIDGGTSGGAISAYGSTWAAGLEVEATDYAHGIGNSSSGSIVASATGDGGQAWGTYVVATNDAQTYNDGIIDVSATGVGGSAIGLFAYSPSGTAGAANTGIVSADASGDYGQAWGLYAAGSGDATTTNSAIISTAAYGYGGTATGMFAMSSGGDAHGDNRGTITAISYGDATGMGGFAAAGNVDLSNSGDISVYSYVGTAVGMHGYAATGNVSLANSGGILAYSYFGNAIGMYGYALAGDVSIDNSGSIGAYSGFGLADGIFASGTEVSVANSGSITAYGYGWTAGIEAQGNDSTTIDNSGGISVATYDGPAFGIYATGGAGGVSIGNTGAISAVGVYSTGIAATASGNVSITNTGDLNVGQSNYTIRAIGIQATNNYASSTINVTNGGDIAAYGYYGATGIDVAALGSGGSASVSNSADIHASQASKYGNGAIGIFASADGDSSIDNTGSITTDSGGASYGAMALSFNGTASVTNAGDIDVSTTAFRYYSGIGILAASTNGAASAVNSGNINVDASKYAGTGIQVSGNTGAIATNSGSIDVGAKYGYGIVAIANQGDASITNAVGGSISVYSSAPDGFAVGVVGLSTVGDVSVVNAGSIEAEAYGNALGVFASAGDGNASADNSGSVYAYSDAGRATGVLVQAIGGNATVGNTGDIAAISYYGDAVAIDAAASGGNAGVTNSGSVHARSYYGLAIGVNAYADGNVDIVNYGSVVAASRYGNAIGVYGYAANGTVTVTSSGSIDVDAYSGIGILGVSTNGDVAIDNAGTILTRAYAQSVGISARSAYGDVAATNSGSIVAYSDAGPAVGVFARADAGDASVNNDGQVYALSPFGEATGVHAIGATADVTNGVGGSIQALSAYGPATGVDVYAVDAAHISNGGAIGAMSYYGQARGIYALAGGDISINNLASGSVDAVSPEGMAIGIFGYSLGGNTTIDNAGEVDASGRTGASGIYAAAYGNAGITSSGIVDVESNSGKAVGIGGYSVAGDVSIDSSGSIHAYNYGGSAVGISGYASAGNVSVDNSGTIESAGGGDSFGAMARAYHGDATVDNSSVISTLGGGQLGRASGIVSFSAYGLADANNSGVITGQAGAFATGIQVEGYAGATATNTGAISVNAKYASGMVAISQQNVSVGNAGELSAVGSQEALGIYARSFLGDIDVTNNGDVYVSGDVNQALGVIAIGFSGSVVVRSGGSIEATSASRRAIGVYALAGVASVINSGTITSSAYSDATGVLVFGYSAASLDNSGAIYARGYSATGASVEASAGAQVVNSGTIVAQSTTGGAAVGVSAQSYGNLLVYNTGTITATDDDYAVAVSVDSAHTATVVNTGTLRAYSATEGEIAVRGGDGVQRIFNYGDIYGAIVTGGGDDTLTNGNGGVWHVTNHSTDFGDGDDTITNGAGGTIVLADGAIHMGASGSVGNAFNNNGRIQVQGDGLIDMGSGAQTTLLPLATLLSSANALPLVNDGLLDFVDGAPDDILTIAGDLGGNGAIDVDISPLHQGADLLYVEGNVADGAVQTVNVSFADFPTSAHIDPIAFAHVAGDSTAGSFVGGQVIGFGANSFLDMQVYVTSQIDATNAADDVFSVGVDVAGLNDPGTLAASIASGAQSLLTSQIGTWRQRMGVLPAKDKDDVGLSPWLRVFSDTGEVDPSHVAGNFGNVGNFDYDQSNSGREVGMNINFRGGFNAGLLLAKSDGTQHLVGPGVGSDHLSGSAFGLYSTWIGSNGFYVDASYRWFDFTADLRSVAGKQSTQGTGGAFNVEAGFTAWNLGGFDIDPQVQYTRSAIGDIRPVHGGPIDFVANGGTSSRGRVGVAFSKALENAGWTWTPYGSVNAVREFDGRTDYTIADTFTGSTRTDGTSAMVELGVGAQKKGFSATVGANWTDGGALQSFVGGQLVLRYTW